MLFLRLFKAFLAVCILVIFIFFIIFVVSKLSLFSDGNASSVSGASTVVRPLLVLKVAIMSDVENDWEMFAKALFKAKTAKVDVIVCLGDLTSYGDLESLQIAKSMLDKNDILYYVLPGDHDLAASAADGDSSGLTNFRNTFGSNFYYIILNNIRMTLLDNSANYTKISDTLVQSFLDKIFTTDFVFISQPIYHPTISRVMGLIDGKKNDYVYEQGQSLLEIIRKSSVFSIFAGDHHVYSRSVDPVKKSLVHYVTGAITSAQSFGSQELLIMNIYDNKEYTIERTCVF